MARFATILIARCSSNIFADADGQVILEEGKNARIEGGAKRGCIGVNNFFSRQSFSLINSRFR